MWEAFSDTKIGGPQKNTIHEVLEEVVKHGLKKLQRQ